MRGGWYLVVTVLLLAGVCCGCRALPRVSPRPEAQSSGMRVDQLVIRADFALAPDHRLVRELVAERDDVSRTLDLPYTTEPIYVHLFRDVEAYSNYLRRKIPNAPSRRAFFVKTDTSLNVYAHWNDRVAEDLRHEVAHGYLHAAVPQIPLWLDEGLAEYFEVPRGHGGLNRPHVSLLADMSELDGWTPDLIALEALTDALEMDQRQYAEAWAWVHFLLSDDERREILIAYLTDLREQGATPPLSRRLARAHIEPSATLVEHLGNLKLEVDESRVVARDSSVIR